MNKFVLLLFTFIFVSSCFKAAVNTQAELGGSSIDNITGGDLECPTGENCVVNGGSDIDSGEDEVIPKVEIRHLIEPKVEEDDNAGEYKRKLTLPKNYNGKLYLAGINISSLADKAVKVRFNFGKDSTPYEIGATISTAPGLTPQTNVEVLVMDLKNKPFEDINLIYDLFDYNEYDFTGGTDGALTEPVSDNRDDKLYCRGLSLKDDNTFSGSLSEGCDDADDVCKFAYAKIIDKGLVLDNTVTGNQEPIIPFELSIQSGTAGFYDDEDSIKLGRCLPDNIIHNTIQYTYDASTTLTLDTLLSPSAAATIGGSSYYYQGPYQPLNTTNWELTGEALKGDYGLFRGIYDDDSDGVVDDDELEYGYLANLFPLYTKFNVLSGTEYLASSGDPDAIKVLQQASSNSETLWMDGCNARASSTHEITGEHIGSCTVTATIEIVARDDETGAETVMDVTNEVKLQLVKPKQLDTSGVDVLLSSYQQCSSSSQCGSDSCCINNRCWSKSIVGQCIEDLPSYGNQETGELCTSDYECSSFCCNKIDGRCAPHDTTAENPSYCSKESGQTCVSKEWCKKHPVTTCAIVNTGTDALGGTTCALRCITAEVYGDCSAGTSGGVGVCTPPCQPTAPTFNPSDPNRCDEAVSYEQLIEEANDPTCGESQ